jgi:tRNA (guanine37-N1)-methyltransferase
MLSQDLPPIDISPPIVSSLKLFDRSQFYREIPVLAVRVTPVKAGLFLKAPAMKGCDTSQKYLKKLKLIIWHLRSLLQLPKVKSIISDQKQPDERLVLLGTVDEGSAVETFKNGHSYCIVSFTALLPPIAREFVAQEGLGLVQHIVKLDYTYWTTGKSCPYVSHGQLYSHFATDEILDAILPPGLPEGTPTSFSTAGHLGKVT